MALQDPNAPFAPSPAYWDDEMQRQYEEQMGAQQFGDAAAPLVGTIFDLPNAFVPPDPQMPPEKAPRTVNGIPVPESYDETESRGGSMPRTLDNDRGRYVDPTTGDTMFPLGDKPAPQPRGDNARIGTLGPGLSGEEVAAGTWVHPEFAPAQEEAPPLQADAISGGFTAEQANRARGVTDADGEPSIREAFAPTAEMPEDYLSAEELGKKWSALSPEEQDKKRAEIENARADLQHAGMVNASTRALKEAEDNARDYQTAVKTAQEKSLALDAEAKKLAQEQIDPLRDVGISQKIAGVLAAFIGGFSMHKTGRNVGLEAVDSLIDNAIKVQSANLANRKDMLGKQQNAIAEQLAMGKDLYQAQETVRLATYDQLIKKLETEVQQFDPRGTRALKQMDTINQAKAQYAARLAKFRDEELKRVEGALKLQRELNQDAETRRHNMAGERNDQTRAYADLLKAKAEEKKAAAEADTTQYTPEQLTQLYGVTDPALVPPVPMGRKQYDKWLEVKQKQGQATKVGIETSDDERNRQFAVGEIVDDQGAPVKFRSTDAATKVAKGFASADLSVTLLDRLITARQQYGWSSDLFKSPEWREMQSDFAQLLLEKKNIDELGVIAGPDMDLMQKALGTKDPTELRDPTSGLKRIRRTTVQKMNSVIRAEAALPKGRKVKTWAPPEPPPPPAETPDDKTFNSIMAFDPKRVDMEDAAVELGLQEFAGQQRADEIAKAIQANDGLLPSTKERIDALRAASVDPSAPEDKRKEAAANLEKLATSAEAKSVREYAARVGTPNPAESAQLSKD